MSYFLIEAIHHKETHFRFQGLMVYLPLLILYVGMESTLDTCILNLEPRYNRCQIALQSSALIPIPIS